MLYRVLIKKG